MYKRICKKCSNEVFHKTEKLLKRAVKNNKPCYSCSNSEKALGEKNSMFGKFHSEQTKIKIKEKRKQQIITKETRDKLSIVHKNKLEEYNHWLGKKHSIETKEKMRISASKRISNNNWHPSFNVTACKIIEEYGNKNGYNFRHALNGGEFFIEELGYWVDGYDIEKNIVIEFYEIAHKYFIENDEIRIKKIKNHLKCEVIILKEWELQ
jgi:hypothetical protein